MAARLIAVVSAVLALGAPATQLNTSTSYVGLTGPAQTTTTSTTVPPLVFSHGDISWLPTLALEAGWPEDTHEKLGQIILRESGGCPRRIGGDRVNPDCSLAKVVAWHHRSDSGLLQINGVHWKQDHPKYHGLICKRMNICTQEPLLDALTNLKAGKLLYDVAGWSPWTPNDKPKRKGSSNGVNE